MKFLIHYIVKTPVKDRNFDFVWGGPVTARDLNDLRDICASEATKKTGKLVVGHEIVIAGIFPIPDGEPAQSGGA